MNLPLNWRENRDAADIASNETRKLVKGDRRQAIRDEFLLHYNLRNIATLTLNAMSLKAVRKTNRQYWQCRSKIVILARAGSLGLLHKDLYLISKTQMYVTWSADAKNFAQTIHLQYIKQAPSKSVHTAASIGPYFNNHWQYFEACLGLMDCWSRPTRETRDLTRNRKFLNSISIDEWQREEEKSLVVYASQLVYEDQRDVQMTLMVSFLTRGGHLFVWCSNSPQPRWCTSHRYKSTDLEWPFCNNCSQLHIDIKLSWTRWSDTRMERVLYIKQWGDRTDVPEVTINSMQLESELFNYKLSLELAIPLAMRQHGTAVTVSSVEIEVSLDWSA